jgi:hypothetical protein
LREQLYAIALRISALVATRATFIRITKQREQMGATPISASLRGVSSQHFGPISRSGTRLSWHELLPMQQRTVDMETANITIALENIQIGPRDNDSDTWMLSKGQLPFEKKLSNQGRLSLRIRSSPGMKWVLINKLCERRQRSNVQRIY